MKILIRADETVLSPEERRYAERAVLMSLGRFQSCVQLVSIAVVSVADAGFPGIVQRQVAIRVDGACRFLVLETAPGFGMALLRALDRARRALERDLERAGMRRPAGTGRLLAPIVRASSRRRARAASAGEDNVQ